MTQTLQFPRRLGLIEAHKKDGDATRRKVLHYPLSKGVLNDNEKRRSGAQRMHLHVHVSR